VFLSLSPITAAALGSLWLAEPLSGGALVAVVGVAVGVWLAHRE
jgi:hypothetical protein